MSKTKHDDPEQSARFIALAQDRGATGSGLGNAVKRLAAQPRKDHPKPKRAKRKA